MLQKTKQNDQVVTAPTRIPAFDRARTFITLLVLVHHSVVNYTYFGNGDRAHWLGFDLVVLFNDSFFMACMFFISGLFVRDSLARKGPAIFLSAWCAQTSTRKWTLRIAVKNFSSFESGHIAQPIEIRSPSAEELSPTSDFF